MLVDALLASADRRPDQIAVADPTVELSYANLVRLTDVVRRHIESATACQRVGILMPSTVGFVATFFGALWARRVAIPINFLLQPAELAAVVADAGIDTIFAIRHFETMLTALPATLPAGRTLKVIYLEDLPLKREMLMERLRRLPPAPEMTPDDTAVILYTSGTSGVPKGVCLSYRNLASNADDCIRKARLAEDHRFLGILPLFHSFGLTAMVNAPIRAGASVYYLPRFMPGSLISTIRERGSSVLMAVASMYTALLRVREAGPDDLKSMIYPISGGEALPMRTFEQFREKFGIEILQGYGLTETSPVVSLNTPWAHRPGSVGQAVPDVTVAAHDDDGRALDAGQTGELWVRGPCVMQGYYNKPAETAAVRSGDWFKTGDMGVIDTDGYVWITGRKKEMIIVGGENVYPREIEAVLEEHPAIAEAAVIGRHDPTRGETVVAFVTCREGASATDLELREFCRDRLANYKIPRKVVVGQDLPRGPTGKILKRKLHDLLAAPPGDA